MTSNGENLNVSLSNPLNFEKRLEENNQSRDFLSKDNSRVQEKERSPVRSSRRRSRSRERRDRHRNSSRDRAKGRFHDRHSRSTNRYQNYHDSRGSQRGHHSRSRSPPRSKYRSRSPLQRKEAPPPSKVLGIFGLSLRTRERDLEELFDEFGKHEKATIVYDHRTDRSRGFGFVYFEHEEDAIRAKEKTNGLELHGRRIRVDFSMTQRPHSPTPGQYMGRKTQRPTRRRSRSRSRSRSRGRSYSH